jgi:hypothetical protein
MTITRRRLCAAGAAVAVSGLAGCANLTGSSDIDDWDWDGSLPVDSVVQHHHPSCGCCGEYVDYLEGHGLEVRIEETEDTAEIKRDLGVPDDAESCHTLEIGDYLVEGHVPLEAIEKLFAEEPDVDGIAAPGMPEYSPGMGPRGDEPLTIYAFEESGELAEFTDV